MGLIDLIRRFKFDFKKALFISLGLHMVIVGPEFGCSDCSCSGCGGCQETKKEEKSKEGSPIKVKVVKYNTELKFKSKQKEAPKTEMVSGFKEYIPNPRRHMSVPKSYIMRPHRYKTMLEKDMYPGLSLIEKSLESMLYEPEKKADIKTYKNGAAVIYIGKVKELFWMDRETRQKTRDEWMKLPKEEMASRLEQMIEKYDNNKGNLKDFVGELYAENLRRIVYDLGGDNLAIDFFEETVFKADFFNFITNHLRTQPYSKTSVELLFMLEQLYSYEQNELESMFKARARANPKRDIRRKVVDNVYLKYKARMEEFGIENKKQLKEIYLKRRFEILDTILKKDLDYRKNDALFIKGKLYFKFPPKDAYDKMEKAYETWRMIKPKDDEKFLFKDAYLKIKQELDSEYTDDIRILRYLIRDFRGKQEVINARGRKFIWEKDKPKKED